MRQSHFYRSPGLMQPITRHRNADKDCAVLSLAHDVLPEVSQKRR
jgi:hypothetical protein